MKLILSRHSYWMLALTILLSIGCSKDDPEPQNQPPIANAGENQSVETGTIVNLNSSASADPDGDSLTFQWTLKSKPDGSSAVLSNSDNASPNFTPDKEGEYVIELIVNDGKANSAPASVTITATTDNVAPTADAGKDTNTLTGSVVTLDGSGSADPDRDPLSFTWSMVSQPDNSSAKLSKASTSHPKFTPDQDGVYIIQLVVSDGKAESQPVSVKVTASVGNVAPVAVAGSDQNVLVGATVNLDGARSSDANNDQLTFSWEIADNPAGSTVSLSDPSSSHPDFTPDAEGSYRIILKVNDGLLDSSPDTVMVTATNPGSTNAIPVANAGDDRDVHSGTTVTLNGSRSSDADGDQLTYTWHITAQPAGSTATLSVENSVDPTFTPDIEGTYVITLTVNDGTDDSAPDAVTIMATTYSFRDQLISLGVYPDDADYLVNNHLEDVKAVLNDQERIFKDMPSLDNMFALPTDPDAASFTDPQITNWSEVNKTKFKRMYGRFLFVINSPKFIDAFNANIGLLNPALRQGDPPAIPYPANYDEFRTAANLAMVDGNYQYKFFISNTATYVAYGIQGLKLKVENVHFGPPTPGAVHNTEALILHELTHAWGYAHANLGLPAGPPPVDNIPYYVQGIVGNSYLNPGQSPLVYDTPDALLTIYFGNEPY